MIIPALVERSMPSENDVVWGNEIVFDNHLGNRNLKKIINEILPEYAVSSKMEKTVFISAIIQFFRSRSNTGGFVKRDPKTGHFVEVNDHYVREKISQEIRNLLHSQYKSSKVARQVRRQARKSFMVNMNQSEAILHRALTYDQVNLNENRFAIPMNNDHITEQNFKLGLTDSTLCLPMPLMALQKDDGAVASDKKNVIIKGQQVFPTSDSRNHQKEVLNFYSCGFSSILNDLPIPSIVSNRNPVLQPYDGCIENEQYGIFRHTNQFETIPSACLLSSVFGATGTSVDENDDDLLPTPFNELWKS